MKSVISTVLFGAVLTACGGGGDSGPAPVAPPVVPPTVDAVTAASLETAKQGGLAAIPAGAGETVYDVAADIGDTWRITLNGAAKTFTVKVLDTQFSLADRSGGYTASTAGFLTTYAGADFNIVVDSRTKLVSGNIKMGGLASTVSGTGYAVGDVAKLAGTYLFVGAMRNAKDGADRFNPKGAFKIGADGGAQLCNGGVFNAGGGCVAVPGLAAPELAVLTLSKDAQRGLLVAKQGDKSFGIVHVHAGDRGLALVIDRFSRNDEGVLRVGTIVAAKQAKIGAEIDGSYACAEQGGSTGRIDIAGAGATVTNNSYGKSHSETVALNKLGNGAGSVDFDGIAVLKDPNDPVGTYSMFVPVSSSIAVEFSTDKSFLTMCLKK